MLKYGPVAQLGAHHIRIVGVVGSNPIRSTKGGLNKAAFFLGGYYGDCNFTTGGISAR